MVRKSVSKKPSVNKVVEDDPVDDTTDDHVVDVEDDPVDDVPDDTTVDAEDDPVDDPADDSSEDTPDGSSASTTPAMSRERYVYNPPTHITYIYIHPENRITSEVITHYEHAEIVSIRAKQLENGVPSTIDTSGMVDPIVIAREEILQRKCPLSIVRHLTDVICEKWDVNEMTLPDY